MTKQLQEVGRLRLEIDRCREEGEWLASAPVPPHELKARAGEQCQALAARFNARYHLGTLAHPNGGVQELQSMLTVSSSVFLGGEVVTPADTELGPMLAWIMGDALVARLHAAIDGMDYRPGPPKAERSARLAALEAERLKLEQREESIICQAETEGVMIPRRADADPTVVLSYDPNGQMAEDLMTIGYRQSISVGIPDPVPPVVVLK